MRWWQWHIIITGGISLLYWLNRPGEWSMMLYAIPINLIIYLLPAYIITLVVRLLRRALRKPTPIA